MMEGSADRRNSNFSSEVSIYIYILYFKTPLLLSVRNRNKEAINKQYSNNLTCFQLYYVSSKAINSD